MTMQFQSTNGIRHIALCYVRFVGSDQDSPERQRMNLMAICNANGWTPEFYEDVQIKQNFDRPAWNILLTRIHDQNVVAVVANDLTRIHRKASLLASFIEQCRTLGITLKVSSNSPDQADHNYPAA